MKYTLDALIVPSRHGGFASQPKSLIAYSLLTKYEWGLLKVLPMPYHLVVDVAGSLFLIISPWLFGFSHEELNVWLPDVVSGMGVIGLVLVSQTEPSYEAADLKAYGSRMSRYP